MMTVNFPTAKPGEQPYSCAALLLMRKKFVLACGFVLSKSRNHACAQWEKACEDDARFKGATVLHVASNEMLKEQFAEEEGA